MCKSSPVARMEALVYVPGHTMGSRAQTVAETRRELQLECFPTVSANG